MNSATVTVLSEADVNLTPVEAFERFGCRDDPVWLFRARCHRVAPGYAVALDLPGDGDAQVLGRLRAVLPGRAIVIEHDQPWRGQLRIKFERTGAARTRVRIGAQVPSEGIEWLARHRGVSLPQPAPTGARRVGLLTSKSGSGAVYSVAAEYMAQLAVEEANACGGVGHRPVELLIADDATDHFRARRETVRLIEAGCQAVFACVTSASFAAAAAAAEAYDVLMVHPVINEGGMEARKVIRFGERPASQMRALSRIVEREAGGNRWFLVGQQYSWSYGAHRAAAKILDESGSRVVAQRYTPLGTREFAAIIDSIRASGADVVMSSLVGADEVAFQQQAHEAGLRDLTTRVSLVMDECTLEHVGAAAGNGIWTALNYFQSVSSPDNDELLRSYREHFGPWAPPLSSLSTNVYEAIRQYLELAALHPDATPSRVAADWRTRKSDTDCVGKRNMATQRLYLARAQADVIRILDEVSA